MYEHLLKPLLFRLDPERVHDFFVWFGGILGDFAPGKRLVRALCGYEHPSLRTRVAGIDFRNPIGLAAGFDKDARLTSIMPAVGFGFMEVGAVTLHPYAGNEGRRLVRLPEDRSLIVYYGLKNIGATAVAKKVRRLKFDIPVGINIAKTNRADIQGAKSVEDYVGTYRMLAAAFAYVTINVSCPNAQDGCMFQEPKLLDTLLDALAKEPKPAPVFLKISSHLSTEEVDGVMDVVARYPFVDGFVVGNLSKRREALGLRSSAERLALIPEGGISGQPVRELATNMIRHIYEKSDGKYKIIGLGGVFTAEDAYEKIRAGASLVQIITGLIYGGPLAVRRINRGLVKLLERDGFATVADAVGSNRPKRIE
ncbi:MAG: dihydroorotate dehydrogenase (quinone) [Candidatus Liptonbacteria bacterium RIFCSPHIGHO2_01_FULL_57_28]|uniref:Dihydroorotate dehydrogenase (quinone) n=1 Tax=Candidatus Liptonbacteria bacterium RIFCSPHIGHO2_01_FULL_57_28 TaxID=1798647 RepID=A0A1G2CDB6_9BACT|nr:MAG: dihydroorotate dehydrogenase (quinone) [Candidatus Liptonbacteria bacterium RIFCSPHIGHO2_01_FULL_57_28]